MEKLESKIFTINTDFPVNIILNKSQKKIYIKSEITLEAVFYIPLDIVPFQFIKIFRIMMIIYRLYYRSPHRKSTLEASRFLN